MAKWEGERLQRLRDMAADGLTYAKIAKSLGLSPGAVWYAVERYNVRRKHHENDAEIRKRWATLIGPMRQRLRADLIAAGLTQETHE